MSLKFRHFCHNCNVVFHKAVDWVFHHNEYHIRQRPTENSKDIQREWHNR